MYFFFSEMAVEYTALGKVRPSLPPRPSGEARASISFSFLSGPGGFLPSGAGVQE